MLILEPEGAIPEAPYKPQDSRNSWSPVSSPVGPSATTRPLFMMTHLGRTARASSTSCVATNIVCGNDSIRRMSSRLALGSSPAEGSSATMISGRIDNTVAIADLRRNRPGKNGPFRHVILPQRTQVLV